MIKLTDLNKSVYIDKNCRLDILKNVNLNIDAGELISITGKSGAGKTTLLNVIGLIDTYDSGAYYFNDELVKRNGTAWNSTMRNSEIGYIMQNFSLIEDYTVAENVMMPLDFSQKKIKLAEKNKMVDAALEHVGMLDRKKQKCKKLSGGEKQRVAIARAIVNNPSLILADEPTGSLDTQNSEAVFEILKQLNLDGKTIIIVTHDIELAEKCDRKIVISDGRIID